MPIDIQENLDILNTIACLVLFGLLLRAVLSFCGQTWIKTFSHSLTLVILPIITFAVTSVITGNLALSLGLVGALSIVRFRNPVKSPFELSVYFLTISLGICASVSFKWMVLLGIVSIFLIFSGGIVQKLGAKVFGKSLFPISFSEGNSLDILEIRANKPRNELLRMTQLVSYIISEDVYIYRFASDDKKMLLKLTDELSQQPDIISVSFSSA